MKLPVGKLKVLLVFLFVMLAVNFLAAQRVRDDAPGQRDVMPTGKGTGDSQHVLPEARAAHAKPSNNGISYHGGPVLKSAVVPIYIIWYGNWTNGPKPSDSQTTVSLIDSLLGATGGIGGSPYELINSTYTDTTGAVTGGLALQTQVFDSYSQGATLSDATLQTVVASHAGHDLPSDTSGVYLVLTSSDVNESSGFCTQYCGFHTHATLNGADIKYAFIGNVDRCPSGCEIQTTSPNGDSGADGMADVIGHESEEAISDPDLNAWFDRRGEENADKCNFKFGPTQTTSSGAKFNQTFGTHNWMIQMNWENANGGGCEQVLGGPFFTQ
jgi:Phosphate-induced protein 1 conserved region